MVPSENRAAELLEMMRSCRLCPRNCGVNRLEGEVGACGVGANAVVSSYGAHFGEESVLVGRFGSGTIFMTGCNLKCIFCQNYDISHLRRGRAVETRRLAEMMMELQDEGCHNINFVTPTHQIARIVEGIEQARSMGLRVPMVYNCGGYESVEVLRLLEGVVDIYMPDIKYGDNEPGARYSGVPDYWDRCREAIREMHRQVGDLEVRRVEIAGGAKAALAVRGLLVRHLVLPNGRAFTWNVARFLADEVSKDTLINVMAQYRPEYGAGKFAEIDRRITQSEFREALEECRRAGLHRFAD
ncbi:MAG: radical SAM protein [Armatimonadota bacterium]